MEEEEDVASAANGSADGALEGGANADCLYAGGCGVLDWEAEGAEVNVEKEEKPGGGVGVETGPLALLFCVIEDNKAGPGMSC